MSTFFDGSFWKTSEFASSLFAGAGVPSTGKFFSGDFWKTTGFGTDFFHGPQQAAPGKRYWAGTFWANSLFKTNFFHGKSGTVSIVTEPGTGGGGPHGADPYVESYPLQLPKPKRFDTEAVLALEELEDPF